MRKLRGSLLTAVTWVIALLFFFPVAWMVFTSFKTEAAAAANPPSIFTALSFDQYQAVFDRGMAPYLLNSLTASVGSTLLVLL